MDLAVGCCEAVVILRDETRPVVALCIVPVYSTLVRRFVVITVGIADVFRVDWILKLDVGRLGVVPSIPIVGPTKRGVVIFVVDFGRLDELIDAVFFNGVLLVVGFFEIVVVFDFAVGWFVFVVGFVGLMICSYFLIMRPLAGIRGR